MNSPRSLTIYLYKNLFFKSHHIPPCDVLDPPHDHIYMGILEMYNSSRDGYQVLRSLLTSTLVVDAKDVGTLLSTTPTLTTGVSAYEYGTQLYEFFCQQHCCLRTYTDREQAYYMYLQVMQTDPNCATAALHIVQDLEKIPATQTLAPKYVLPQLAITLSGRND